MTENEKICKLILKYFYLKIYSYFKSENKQVWYTRSDELEREIEEGRREEKRFGGKGGWIFAKIISL